MPGQGGIILAGVADPTVQSRGEMGALLERGSLLRKTGSTNMNAQSSRSHAIFSITVEQRRMVPAEPGAHAWHARLRGRWLAERLVWAAHCSGPLQHARWRPGTGAFLIVLEVCLWRDR